MDIFRVYKDPVGSRPDKLIIPKLIELTDYARTSSAAIAESAELDKSIKKIYDCTTEYFNKIA